jgi:hypothetical protein
MILGVAAGLLGGLAANLYTRAVAAANGGREAAGAAPGADRFGRGMQPAQAIGPADRDAAVQVGTAAYRAVTGGEPSAAIRPRLGTAAHYAFSAAAGAWYVCAADRLPLLRSGFGTVYGTIVWLVADEGAMPALGLSRRARQLPAGVHAYSIGGHWVYGATLEAVRRW